VAGGYCWRGARGRFCSGIDHSSWVVAGGALAADSETPEARWFLIPRADIEVDDDWFTSGMRGTGSKSIRVPEAFIPEHRSISAAELEAGRSPGQAVNPGPLYRLAASTWTFVLPATPVGIARGALDVAGAGLRQRLDGLPAEHVAEHSAALARFARASVEVDVATLLLRARARRLMESAGTLFSRHERALHRRDLAYAVQQARHATNDVMELSGGSGIYETTAIQRMWRDCNAAAAHFSLAWEPSAVAYGRSALGLAAGKTERPGR
jgi:alkylation response protein AidB-like acyl-CoA dehydrogenase